MEQIQALSRPSFNRLPTESRSSSALASVARWPVQPGRLLVALAPHAAADEMLALVARLAIVGPPWLGLHVLDGGNRFNACRLARHLRQPGWSGAAAQHALERIRVQRAFTCYQMTALLEAQATSVRQDSAEAPLVILVLDLLDTFYDESVSLSERRQLAQRSATALQHLAHPGGGGRPRAVVVSLRPPRPQPQDSTVVRTTELQEMITAAADTLWLAPALSAPADPAAVAPAPAQLPLW